MRMRAAGLSFCCCCTAPRSPALLPHRIPILLRRRRSLLWRQPWWRWVHVVLFIPFGMPYLLLTCVLILISWVTLACFLKDLEWVPTARHAGAETHRIKMREAAKSGEGQYNTFAAATTASAKPMTNAPQPSEDEARGLLAKGPAPGFIF